MGKDGMTEGRVTGVVCTTTPGSTKIVTGPVFAGADGRGVPGTHGGNCTEVQAVRKMSEAVMIKLAGRWQGDAPRLTAGEKEKCMVIILVTAVLTMGQA